MTTKNKNKHGLSRYIPTPIRREVRRRCGFGCVLCGNAIITYEHFDPPFAKARRHDPKGITLLCGSHQIESAKRLLSKNTIQQADKNPLCRQVGYAKHLFDIGNGRPSLSFAGNDFTQCGPKIEFEGESLFELLPPELKSHRWRLSARFRDQRNRIVCEIKENELLVNSGNFDVLETATRFEVRPEDGSAPYLEFEIDASRNALVLHRYSVITPKGRLTIGEGPTTNMPLLARQMNKVPMLSFESGNSHISFAACSFVSPGGIKLRFVNGGIQFGP